jgi:signal transduction histidine kinase/FixJ family two-component response regulator
LTRTNVVYGLLANTNVLFRLENISLYLLLPALSSFLEYFNFGKTLKANRVFFCVSLFFALVPVMFYKVFGEGILYLWQRLVLVEIVYVVGYDMLYVFFQNIKIRQKADKKNSSLKIFLMTLCGTPQGNIIICSSLMVLAAFVDVIESIVIGHGVVKASPLAIFLFIITTTVIFTRRFGLLFRRLDEMNNLLERSNQNLEDTVRKRTRELEQQTEVAKSASRAKSDFLARMSHEIRTPLNVVLGLSEVELRKDLPGGTLLNLEKVYRSGAHLLEIVNDILDISKIESGNFEINPVEYEFPALINDTVQLNIVRIGVKPIRFNLNLDESIPVKLYGDELRIKQILNNLLSNALKYTEEGEVRLLAGWTRQNGGALLMFAVKDTGRGIKKQDMDRLFSEYAQFDTAANRQIEGTGLGLSITRGLVEAMGGSITVESEYGKGSVFRVSLPQGIIDESPVGLDQVEKLRSLRPIGERNRGSLVRSYMPYGKVLVVDDLEMNLDVMLGLLMPYGLKVDTALSGAEAVDLIRRGVRYDLVFMDHMMPGMDGVEAARIIRNETGTGYARTVPIVVLTANAIAGNREMFLENGFNDFISKPIDIKRLDMILNQWIRDKQSEETLRAVENREDAGEAGEHWFPDHPVEGVDFARMRNLYGGAAVESTLRAFVTHTPSLLEKMAAHLERSLPDYAIEVHGLKGACGAVCAGECVSLAGELERAARAGDLDLVRSRHGELEQTIRSLLDKLGALLAVRGGEGEGGRAEPDRDLLLRLSAAAGEFNSNMVEEILGELERYRYERGEELIRRLREQAAAFDYEAMGRRLEEFLAGKEADLTP